MEARGAAAATPRVDEIIQHCVTLGVSGIELRTQPVESFLGAPAPPAPPAAAGGGQRGRGAASTSELLAASALDPELQKWRLSASMAPVRALRKRFDDAGVLIEIIKVDGIFDMPDAVVDYQFELATNLGARVISTEIAEEGPRRLGRDAGVPAHHGRGFPERGLVAACGRRAARRRCGAVDHGVVSLSPSCGRVRLRLVVGALLLVPGVWSGLTTLNATANQSLPSAYGGRGGGSPADPAAGLSVDPTLLDYLTPRTAGILAV